MIFVLLALNVVLIVPLFVNGEGRFDDASGPPSSATPGGNPSPQSGSPAADPSAPTEARPAPASDKPRRLLAANSDRLAWRAEASSCGESSKLQYTTDSGHNWHSTDPGLMGVVRLRAFGDSSVFAIGADDKCRPVYAVDAFPGDQWQQDSSMLADAWFREPENLNRVHDPQDRTSEPCGESGLVDLAGQGNTKAAVVCGNGALKIRDGGADWKTATAKSDIVALSADDNRFVMVQENTQCLGFTTRWFDVKHNQLTTAKKDHCFRIPAANPNDVTVSNRGTTVWLWSGGVTKTR